MHGVRLIILHKEFGFKCKYSMQKIVLKIKKEIIWSLPSLPQKSNSLQKKKNVFQDPGPKTLFFMSTAFQSITAEFLCWAN